MDSTYFVCGPKLGTAASPAEGDAVVCCAENELKNFSGTVRALLASGDVVVSLVGLISTAPENFNSPVDSSNPPNDTGPISTFNTGDIVVYSGPGLLEGFTGEVIIRLTNGRVVAEVGGVVEVPDTDLILRD